MGGVKINIGSGTQIQPTFRNFDNSPSVVVSKVPVLKKLLHRMGVISHEQLLADWSGVEWKDVTRGLPFADDTVDKIYSSHFLEHLPEKKAKRVLVECMRVLKVGGRMRLVVPDLLFHAERYVERTRKLLEQGAIIESRDAHDEFLETVAGAYLNKTRKGLHHSYMYDLPTLVMLLKAVGFKEVLRCDYREGVDLELASMDSRPNESLHLEVVKP